MPLVEFRGETIPKSRIRFVMPGYEDTRFYTRAHEETGETIVGIQWYQPDTTRVVHGEPNLPPMQGNVLECPLGESTLEDACWHLVRITVLHEAGEYFIAGDVRPWNPHDWLWWVEEEQTPGPSKLRKGGIRQ